MTAATTVDQVHRGQTRMAYRLADSHAGQLLHVHGLGWYVWDGRRWAEDDQGQATRAVLDVLRAALGNSLGDRDLQQDVRRCESAAGIAGVLTIAAALEPFAATVRDLDADPYLLNCANGTLDLRTGALQPHRPADRITKITGAAYDPDAAGATWARFLDRVLPDSDVAGFLQRYAGLALCGRVLEHKLAILTGTGRNGKSVLYGALAAALGDYAGTAEPDLFMHRDGAHPTGELDLRGVRWVVVSESDRGRRLAEATVKRLTGGDPGQGPPHASGLRAVQPVPHRRAHHQPPAPSVRRRPRPVGPTPCRALHRGHPGRRAGPDTAADRGVGLIAANVQHAG